MDKKGFTLAELLIVVAIIAILVAISIPVFSVQIERSKEAVDMAAIRNALSEVSKVSLDPSLAVREGEGDKYKQVTLIGDEYQMWVKVTQLMPKWQSQNNNDTISIFNRNVEVPEISDTAHWVVGLDDLNQVFIIDDDE